MIASTFETLCFIKNIRITLKKCLPTSLLLLTFSEFRKQEIAVCCGG